MKDFFSWFTGGSSYHYHNLFHCMDNDLVTVTLVLVMCAGVFSGYMVIAYRWFEAAKEVPDSQAKKALNDLKWIFLFCGVCGYLWVLMEAVWPAWRFYMFFLAALNFVTWRYVLRVNSLESIYKYLKDRDDLVHEIEEKQEEIERLQRSKL